MQPNTSARSNKMHEAASAVVFVCRTFSSSFPPRVVMCAQIVRSTSTNFSTRFRRSQLFSATQPKSNCSLAPAAIAGARQLSTKFHLLAAATREHYFCRHRLSLNFKFAAIGSNPSLGFVRAGWLLPHVRLLYWKKYNTQTLRRSGFAVVEDSLFASTVYAL